MLSNAYHKTFPIVNKNKMNYSLKLHFSPGFIRVDFFQCIVFYLTPFY